MSHLPFKSFSVCNISWNHFSFTFMLNHGGVLQYSLQIKVGVALIFGGKKIDLK